MMSLRTKAATDPRAPNAGAHPAGARVARAAALVALAVPLALAGCARAPSDALERGRTLFLANQLDEARPLFERAVREAPRDPDALAWLAETLRRQGDRARADSIARAALALDPRHAIAHEVMGWNLDPQYGEWAGADRESSWVHFRASVESDPGNASAWCAVWMHALSRGDTDLERQALRRLVETGFFTRSVLAHSRWLMRNLPENAVLLTNGDMDTYPTNALQWVESLRPDVAIVNVSLLNTDWYRRVVRDRYRVPMPFGPEALDSLTVGQRDDGTVVYVQDMVLKGWLDMQRAGRLTRPLAFSCTVPDPGKSVGAEDRLVLSGSYFLVSPRPARARVDTTRVRESLLALDPAEFAPPWASDLDRCPVRRQGSPRLGHNVLAAAVRYIDATHEADRQPDAEAMREWASAFARGASMDSTALEVIAEAGR
jgi:hypothetical protein